MKRFLRSAAGPLIVLTMFGVALWLLHKELHAYHLRDFLHGLAGIPLHCSLLAAGLTLLNFAVLIGYDYLGVRYIHHPMKFSNVALVSFLSYSIGNSMGAVLGGTAVRYRLYSALGLSAIEIVKLILILGITFWVGTFALAAAIFVVDPIPVPERLPIPFSTTRPVGWLVGLVALGYLALCAFRRTPLRIWKWQFSLPPLPLAVMQYLIAALDLTIAGGVLFVLLPASVDVSFVHFLGIYVLAVVASVITHVPGGLGVLELIVLVMLAPSDPHDVLGAMLAYRLIYYLVPFAAGISLLGGKEVLLHRRALRRGLKAAARLLPIVAPRVLAIMVFLSGVLLLFSGATPAQHDRLKLLRHFLPLPVLEFSHFLNSIVGVVLLVLARGLQRRVEVAYYAAVAMLGSGILVSLLKGLDYEEAIALAVMLAVLLPCRQFFYRQGALLTERFTLRWFAAVAMVLACVFWLLLFAYKHVEYTDELWWQFTFRGNAPRSLRAVAGAAIAALVFVCWRLVRAHARPPQLPGPSELADARAVVEQSPKTNANLALLGDKRLLFNADKTALLMYGVAGRSWVSMGDPIGDETAVRELAWEFYEMCDAGGRWPVFYQVDEARVPVYVEMGLTLIKLGEEARVPLKEFNLEGGSRKDLRRTNRRLTEDGYTFEIIEPPLSDDVMAELKHISDAWLSDKDTAEKGFSLGFFNDEYLRSGPVALVRKDGRGIAFANVWRGANNEELSVDLMRHLPDSPHGVMDFLFVQLMLWGSHHGFDWFNLGMAPLSGIEQERLSPLWSHVAALAFRHGEHFYNFQGLRQYKEKFDPQWTSKYLASPGGLRLPVILTNVTTLISSGLPKRVAK